MTYDVIIIGAGAAGLFCAIEAARRNRRVLILDHAKKPGEKIRISGGGRCNFTNFNISPEKFLSQNPRFALSALKRYTQWDFISRIDVAGIAWHEKTLGQLFCDGSSQQIIDMLMRDLSEAGAELRLGVSVTAISSSDDGFRLDTSSGRLTSQALVIATGGKSIPKMGATGFGYRVADQFGLRIEETRAGLVPLTFDPHFLNKTKALPGISSEAVISGGGAVFREGMLFTHRGLSGPSILQISSYLREGQSLKVNFLPDCDIATQLFEDRRMFGKQSIKNALGRYVPEKLASLLVQEARVSGNLADQNKDALQKIATHIHSWSVTPTGSEGYRTAEVTLGGVSTDELDARTMETKKVKSLYFIGEVVDVTGWLGGYNFQWAWSSGWAAGQVC